MDVLVAMDMFRRVAEAGSFSAAARGGSLSQSSVSKHIAALESRLGTKLFVRSTRQLHLTEAGSEYLKHCVRILEEIAEAELTVSRGQALPTGTLKISATATFGRLFILPFLWDFLVRYPALKVDMVLEDRYVDLVKEGVDVAVRVGPLTDSSMIASRLGESERVIVASPDYLKSRGEPETPCELRDHDCLIYSLQTSPNEWEFNTEAGVEKVRVGGRFSASNPEAISEATLAGLGISVVMLWSVREHIAKGRLKVILSDYQPTPYEVNAVYPNRQFVPQKVRKLIEHLRACYVTHYPLVAAIRQPA